MANAHRGEVDIRIGERNCILRFGWSAIAELQSSIGKEFEIQLGAALVEYNVSVLAEILAIGLREKWPEVTQQDIIDASPPLVHVTQATQLALRYAFQGTEDPAPPDKKPSSGASEKGAPKNVVVEGLKAALELGYSEADFWASTPYMTRLACAAHAQRDRNQYRHDMFTAWHAAAFGRIKRIPSFSKAMRIVEPVRGPVQKQTPDEILVQVEMITAMLGGKDKRKRNKKKDN